MEINVNICFLPVSFCLHRTIFVADANMQHQKQFNSKEDSNGEAKCEKMLFEHRNTEER